MENITDGVQDRGSLAQIRGRQFIINRTRAHLDKRREEYRRSSELSKNGPLGEKRSAELAQRVELVELKCILDDPNFSNLRLKAEEEELNELSESMRHEGLKVPITLISIFEGSSEFYLRAGFRRTTVARRLGWKQIPAIILPHNTPAIEEYWTNIIENSVRSKLHTYEVANAARLMRNVFHVSPLDFAMRAGYSESYVCNLLRCLDRLPEEVLEAWRTKAPIPIDYYIKWSIMEPSEALNMMRTYAGRNPHVVRDWQPPTKRPRPLLVKMASAKGLKRMQQIRFAVEVARKLDPNTRALCLKLIDFCSGARNDVPGLFNPEKKQHIYESRRREDRQPDLSDLSEPPPAPTLDSDEENK